LSVTTEDGTLWQPDNFEREEFGSVPLYESLGHSYNLSTARLGMELGVSSVIETLHRLGFERDLTDRPSLLLGAVDMSPFEVAGIYHTIAADGFYSPLRSIRAVYTADNYPLKRYPYEVEQRFSPESMHLLQYALQVVVREGTGKNVYKQIPSDLMVAGKTGTSNDQRDSWFTGFSGSYLSVVWLGRDDNGKTPFTGGTGALRVWGDVMKGLQNDSLAFRRPDNVNYVWIDEQGFLSRENCRGARYLPFVVGSEPTQAGACYQKPKRTLKEWFNNLFK
jgi:penicillin-binding protein 1B